MTWVDVVCSRVVHAARTWFHGGGFGKVMCDL